MFGQLTKKRNHQAASLFLILLCILCMAASGGARQRERITFLAENLFHEAGLWSSAPENGASASLFSTRRAADQKSAAIRGASPLETPVLSDRTGCRENRLSSDVSVSVGRETCFPGVCLFSGGAHAAVCSHFIARKNKENCFLRLMSGRYPPLFSL